MRAIILAAGQGTRLRPLTDDRPKCMVELEGKPLLEQQLEVLRGAGIEDIHVVGGYRADWLQRPDITLHINERFDQTNMVATLFTAESIMAGGEDLIIAYGDIVYEPRVFKALLACNAPVCLTVDRAWRRYWEARMDDPLSDAETLKLTDGNLVTDLGKEPSSYEEIQGQYMGLVKVRADHVSQLPAVWRAMDRDATYDGKDYDNMYMTSFLQHLIDSGWETRAAFVDNGWLEVDSREDLEMVDRGFWRPGG
ncbi:NTP transferase domain-containing protein [Halorhodospira halochloris]|uniref:phosphocholine cytidylyltransferase family protein n=1 Tax=Halorhodospira halochloris TaxID=1052 RepID=UPI001EE8CF91|nr:phosphocholine cytidylyltransferase family protein [Halorhodospira halochloris]MCG5549559.1 phosphocholine cytidylyltransferase family protein [Halorhodospira halochloris]